MNSRSIFDKELYLRFLIAALGVTFIGFVIAYHVYGELLVRDIIGSLITAPLAAYLLHLWYMVWKEEQ